MWGVGLTRIFLSRLGVGHRDLLVVMDGSGCRLRTKGTDLTVCNLGAYLSWSCIEPQTLIVPLKYIEYGFGYIIIRSPYTPDSIYLMGPVKVPGSLIGPKPSEPFCRQFQDSNALGLASGFRV